MDTETSKVIAELTKALTDKGKIIEAGWVGLRYTIFPMNIDMDRYSAQLIDMRKAFFAGAQHLFSSILAILDEGTEATPADLQRMTLINEELESFVQELRTEEKRK